MDIVAKGHRETHTFYARAVDQAGNQGIPTSFKWEIGEQMLLLDLKVKSSLGFSSYGYQLAFSVHFSS
jgi:hypothetical protein